MRKRHLVMLLSILLLMVASLMMSCPATGITHLVTFDSQGGSPIVSQRVSDGALVTEPAAPTYGLNLFAGWYKETGGTNEWVFSNDIVTSNITLYASWDAVVTTHAK